MAFTYGFYDSLNGDRRYKASQFNDLIGSLLTDGVFENIGSKLFVTVGSGMKINVGTGKAWFDNTWNVNDSVMVLTVPQSDITRPRYDTVVLDVNSDLNSRENKIMIVSGTPAVNPTKPVLTNVTNHHQHPLAHILVPAAATSITASNIEIVVGQSACPFVTSILQKTDITGLYNKWEADFQTWFNNLQSQLTSNVVTNLQNQINQLGSEDTKIWNYVKPTNAVCSALGLANGSTLEQVTEKLRSLIATAQSGVDNGVKITMGSYNGTGVGGAARPTSITFPFAPSIVFLPFYKTSSYAGTTLTTMANGRHANTIMISSILTESYQTGVGFGGYSGDTHGKKSSDGRTFSWYFEDSNVSSANIAMYQYTSSGSTYYYVAIK